MMLHAIFFCASSWFILGQVNSVNYIEKYFDQRIDHFNMVNLNSRTFKQRYIYNDSFWNRGKGPIFFLCGNENDIVTIWKSTKFVLEIAPVLGALVVYAEHRYFGASLPFGAASFVPPSIGYLDIQQVLSDYAFLLTALRDQFRADNSSVIAFGASYGGILAAFMRFKLPNLVDGAIASGAPVFQAAGMITAEVTYKAVTKVFKSTAPACVDRVREAFAQVAKWHSLAGPGLHNISKAFHLCAPPANEEQYQTLLRWIRKAFVAAAMLNYPYSLIKTIPAYPVKAMCNRLLSAASAVDGLYSAMLVLYNTGRKVSPCHNVFVNFPACADPNGCALTTHGKAWDYLACTVLNWEGGSNGVTDMFPVVPFNASMRDKYCEKTWKVKPHRKYIRVVFGGMEVSSNTIFTNGDMDPWSAGSMMRNVSKTMVSAIVKGGAHLYELQSTHKADTPAVKKVRDLMVLTLMKWSNVAEYEDVQLGSDGS